MEASRSTKRGKEKPGAEMAQREETLDPKARTDPSTTFLRAARSGNYEKVVEILNDNPAVIGASNANGLNALHLAAKDGHVNVVLELLNHGIDVDSATKKGNTALHIACLAGQMEVVKLLIHERARINIQSEAGFTPLYMAAQENHADLVKYLLDKGANATLATEEGFTPLAVALQQEHTQVVNILMDTSHKGRIKLSALHVAAKKDDVRAAIMLLENELNQRDRKGSGIINEPTKSGFTPLHIAAHYGNQNVAKVLIEHGADVNFKARNSITPLHVGSKWGRRNVVSLLLNNHAIVDCKTRDGLTPLHCAARSGHDIVVNILVENRAPVLTKTRNGLTPLHMAVQGDHVDCARILISHKANVDDVTVDYLTPLHVAAHCGNVATAKLLLDRNCDVNARALNGFTPLHIACKKNRIKVIELLLQNNASVSATTESGLTPLHVASFMGYTEIVQILLQLGCDPNAPTVRGETPLHLATRGSQVEAMKLLLKNGAKVDAKAKEDQTPLHTAARTGSVEAVQLLLQHKANPNAPTKELYTPLHIAAKEGHEDVIQVLLDNDADAKLKTSKGFSPLHIAAKYGNDRVANLLLNNGADPNSIGKNGLTPLHVATHYNQVQMVNLLLEKKSSPHATAKNGYTPLHIAAKKNEIEIATALLRYGAKPNSESRNGFMPLHLAAQEGHTDMVALLLRNSAQVNCKAKNGLTPLHLAAQEDHVPVAEVLVKHETEIDPQTKAGYTPLHTACHFGQLNMIRFLLEHRASVEATTKAGHTPLHQAAQQGHVLVINMLLRCKADPNVLSANGQTPLSIAQCLGYISVVEILKEVTHVTSTETDDKYRYKLMAPEVMQEAAMSDEDEDDEADEKHLADQSYQFLTTGDDIGGLHEEPGGDLGGQSKDPFEFEQRASLHSSAGISPTQEDIRYTAEDVDAHYGGAYGQGMGDKGKWMAGDTKELKEKIHPLAGASAVDDQIHYLENGSTGAVEVADFDKASSPLKRRKMKSKATVHVEETVLTKRIFHDEHGYIETHFDDDEVPAVPEQVHASKEQPLGEGQPYSFLVPAKDQFDMLDIANQEAPDADEAQWKGTGTSQLVSGKNIMIQEELVPDSKQGEDEVEVVTVEEVARDVENKYNMLAAPPDYVRGHGMPLFKSNLSETESRMFGSTYSGMSFSSSLDPDNVALHRQPIYSGFLVSFLVDARGGAMRGCRHSGVRIIIPPGRACMPTRITCKLVKREKLPQPPPLMEGEALASRVLVMGPSGAKFLGPVVLEVPHFASLRGMEREIAVLRSENGQTWREHTDLATLDTIQNTLCGSFEDLESAEELYQRRITRIITSDFPKYFAIVTRIRQETSAVSQKGGIISSTVIPQVQTVFPQGAVTKSIKLGLQAHPVPKDLILKVVGDKISVSPVVTIEPRRRKFHQPITVTIPLPPDVQTGNQSIDKIPNLRLLCSMNAAMDPTEWEDITGSTPMTQQKNCVSFTTTVSARFWLVSLPHPKEAVKVASRLYTEMLVVPFMANFVVFVKRLDEADAQLRLFCMTDDKMDKTLESQEKFAEIARSRDVEVLDGKPQWIECIGNLLPVVKSDKSDKQPKIAFRAFRENRQSLNVRVRNLDLDPTGTLLFMLESHTTKDQVPICNLSVTLPPLDGAVERTGSSMDTAELQEKLTALKQIELPEEELISKAELRLTDIAEYLEDDWIPLARQLKMTPDDIAKVQTEYNYVTEQALVMLHLWIEKNKDAASGNALERALHAIRREDIINKCICAVEEVTDVKEKQVAKICLESDEFDDQLDHDHHHENGPVAYEEGPFEDEIVSSIAKKVRRDQQTFENLDQPTHDQPDVQMGKITTHHPTENEKTEQVPLTSSATTNGMLDVTLKAPLEETSFEDWIERKEMSFNDPNKHGRLLHENSKELVASEIRKKTIDGELDIRIELSDDEDVRDDGTIVRRQVITKRHVRPVTEITTIDGVEADWKTTEKLVKVEVDEDILELPPGVDDSADRQNVITKTSVKETEEWLTGDVPLYRKVTKTTVTPLMPRIESQAARMVGNAFSEALDEVKATSRAKPIEASDLEDEEEEEEEEEPDMAVVKVYTDMQEGVPEVETDVQEFEETLQDGTIIKRRVIKTKQKQTITKRVVMEGPEDELPVNEEEATEMLKQVEAEEEPTLTQLENRNRADFRPETDVQEYEETLPDGTIVKRRITTTTEQRTTKERVVLEEDDDFEDDTFERPSDNDIPNSNRNTGSQMVKANADDEETATVMMKKEIRKKKILRDGKEETIITEDVHMVQDEEEPQELHDSVQMIIDQFMEGTSLDVDASFGQHK